MQKQIPFGDDKQERQTQRQRLRLRTKTCRSSRSLSAGLQKVKLRRILVDRDLAEELEVGEHLAGSKDYGGQRVVGDGDREAGFFADALVEVLDESASTGEDDAAVGDIGGELGRGALEGYADGVDDGGDALGEGFAYLRVLDGDGLGDALDEVAALDLHFEGLVEGEGGTELDFDLLGGALTDEQVVFALEVGHDRLVHLVPGHADGARVDDAGERDDGDVGGAAADVDDHIAAGLGDGKTGADGGDHGLLDEVDLGGLGAVGGVHDGALFYLCDLRGHADDDARVHHHLAVVGLLDEVVQHLFGVAEVGDDAVLHGLDGDDVAGGAAEHLFGFFADGLDLVGDFVDGDDGGLVDYDAFAMGEDEGVCCTKVNCQVAGKKAEK